MKEENNFDEYNSSQITPQYTLLEKFHKVIDWLKGSKKSDRIVQEITVTESPNSTVLKIEQTEQEDKTVTINKKCVMDANYTSDGILKLTKNNGDEINVQVKDCFRHFIHFSYFFPSGNRMEFKVEFYDNHKARYVNSDMSNIFACGKVGHFEDNIHGTGVVILAGSSANRCDCVYWSAMESGMRLDNFAYANVSDFVDEE